MTSLVWGPIQQLISTVPRPCVAMHCVSSWKRQSQGTAGALACNLKPMEWSMAMWSLVSFIFWCCWLLSSATGMVQAWVAHFVTPLKCTYDKYDWRVMSQKPHKKHKSPNKHDHHAGEAAHPSSGVNLMNPRCLRGGQPCACLFKCRRQSDLIYSINLN